MSATTDISAGVDVLMREAMYLDERRWDEWLDLFAPDVEFWVPTWTAEGELTKDPRCELSLMYLQNRGGLGDRIARIRTGLSPAATPLPRTTHMVSNIRATEPPTPTSIKLRSSWVCHAFFPLIQASHAFFGRAEYQLDLRDDRWLITRKKTILENDHIPMAIDFFCL
jgi:3-phenylpropionate/cinnamic acid dioxygenase small subunit